ncbi:hypothetical protein [Rhodohalobacter mucosus]|uniref:Uncharacterized protein n=1 Tax=Rhodohalobacter mucosus TaxID=2079485 RepID=A0A316TQM9_9BACT|nr:hypothetical protein [Rhodohalobacter mucosus]PWN06098.1 hypothetical protein DDZ15_09600 [Rhodohalobacter mucosus]
MTEEIRLTRDIHNFVRDHMCWEESLRLLDEIVESEEWIQHLEIDMLLYEMASKEQELRAVKPSIPEFLLRRRAF